MMNQDSIPHFADNFKPHGLTKAEVQERIAAGQKNNRFSPPAKSLKTICRANIYTLFNFLNFSLATLVILVALVNDFHYLVNIAFMGVIFSNTAIGIIQEYRAKRTVDRLALLSRPKITVWRDIHPEIIDPEDLVLDDLLLLQAGNQVVVDAEIEASYGLEVDESLLTGESVGVEKANGAIVLSGSFILAGEAWARVLRINDQTHAAKILQAIAVYRPVQSKILTALNAIIRILSLGLVPIGLILLGSKVWQSWPQVNLPPLIISTVAALVGMIPEGLMLMTSIALAVGVVNLGRHQALVQSLAAIEGLARINVLCLDKTGTLTSGKLNWQGVLPLNADWSEKPKPGPDSLFQTSLGEDLPKSTHLDLATLKQYVQKPEAFLNANRDNPQLPYILAALLAQPNTNSTQAALIQTISTWQEHSVQAKQTCQNLPKIKSLLPFQSKNKYNLSYFDTDLGTTVILGAPEIIWQTKNDPQTQLLKEKISQMSTTISATGARVLLLGLMTEAKPLNPVAKNNSAKNSSAQLLARGNYTPLCLLILQDEIRPEAKAGIAYLQSQGINLKIISGDNPRTVSAIAKRLNLAAAEQMISLADLDPARIDYPTIAAQYTIFGRVSPEQKQQLILALQNLGHKVGMIGDGINDVLALKTADCSLALASGADAARAGADIVLLDNNLNLFSEIIKEGRRVINNVELVAALFLAKTTYACCLALSFIFLPYSFPLFPIQLTLISALTIGLPAFFLALQPNLQLVEGEFLEKVSGRALPSGITSALIVMLIALISMANNLPASVLSAFTFLTLYLGGMTLLFKVAKPFNRLKVLLYLGLNCCAVAAVCYLPDLFLIRDLLNPNYLIFVFLQIFHLFLPSGLELLLPKIKALKPVSNKLTKP